MATPLQTYSDSVYDRMEDLGGYESILGDDLLALFDDITQADRVRQLFAGICGEIAKFGVPAVKRPVAVRSAEPFFSRDLSGFLKSLEYPRLEDVKNAAGIKGVVLLPALDFLLTELQTAKIMVSRSKTQPSAQTESQTQTGAGPSQIEQSLAAINAAFPVKSSGAVPAVDVLRASKAKLQALPNTNKKLMEGSLTEKQMKTVKDVYEGLSREFELRRNVLVERMDVLTGSFFRSDKLKRKEDRDECETVVAERRKRIKSSHDVGIDDIHTARAPLLTAQVSKVTSSASHTSVKSVIIGKVPDRGGNVQAKAEGKAGGAAGPAFKPRTEGGGNAHGGPSRGGGQSGGRGGHQGGGGRGGKQGGRVQGGWNDGGGHRGGGGGGRGRGRGRGGK